MKKIISLLLVISIVFTLAIPAMANAEVSEQKTPIVFVNGVGQSWTYQLDENGSKSIECNGETYTYSAVNNLINFTTDTGAGKFWLNYFAKSPAKAFNAIKVVCQLVITLFTGKYALNAKNVATLIDDLLYQNIKDENGKLPEEMFTPCYKCPISELPYDKNNSMCGKTRFYRCIPCEDILSEYGEENAFWYCYSPWSRITDISDGLDDFIENTVLSYFPNADKVVLVPMSMGAAVTSQYLYDYGYKNRIEKVVSIVGCWQGSDILADLIEQKWCDNSAELFYTGWDELLDDVFAGNIINLMFRFGKKANLTKLVNTVFGAVCDEVVLKSSAMLSLISPERYPAIKEKYLSRKGYEDVLKETDKYHVIQTNLRKTMSDLEANGTQFYFISGYGLGYGEGYSTFGNCENYSIMKFLYSAGRVNSDEIIDIESTCPGAVSVTRGTSFSEDYIANKDSDFISPDKSVDINGAWYKDHCFLFNKQIHQLDHDNTALRLAFDIATGKVTQSGEDCAYPRFNESRCAKGWKETIAALQKYIEDNESVADKAQDVALAKEELAKATAVYSSNVNNRASDDATMAEVNAALKKLMGEEETEKKEAFTVKIGEKLLDPFCNFLYKTFGARGLAG